MHTADYLPTRRGFDRQYGHYCGAIDYFTHERDGGFDWHRDDRVCRDEGYSTQLIAREAVRIVRTRDRTRPFFLYVAFNAVHGPHQVPARYAEPYAPLREPRRTYAGMVAAMDEAVGQIVDALDSEAIRQHTLILFSSDNGGPAPGRVTDNGPLRGAKGTLYEGGVRVCALANWPGRLPAGCVVNAPVHAVDWMPTLLGLADAQLEPGPPLDGRDVWANIVGASGGDCEREILLNASPDSGALIVGDWKLVLGQRAWDGVLPGEPGKRAGKRRMGKGAAGAVPVQLFNLADDTGESRNLAETCPDRVTAMRARYDAFAAAALPPANREAPPGFKPPAVWGPDLGR
jgi:arylsulfatase A-like enzyme